MRLGVTRTLPEGHDEISQSQKCLAEAPTRADESWQNENTPSMKVRL